MLRADDEVGVERPGGPGVRPRAVELVEEALDQVERRDPGSIGSCPARSRANAASADGENEVSARACSMVGGHGRSCVAPHAETAVRSASIGLVVGGSARRTVMTAGGIGRGRQPMGRVPVAGPQQVRDRRVGAVGDEVADPIAAVEQPAALAVDVAQARLAGDDAFEAGGVRARSRASARRRHVRQG